MSTIKSSVISLDRDERTSQKLGGGPRVGKCPTLDGDDAKFANAPTSLTYKAGKCPTFAQEGTWVHLELTDALYFWKPVIARAVCARKKR